MSIIIPCAGENKRFNANYPKFLAPLNTGESILSRQIKILHKKFPASQITVVCGYESNRIAYTLPSYVNVVLNDNYSEANVGYSVELGMREGGESFLVVFGDLVFTAELFDTWPTKSSIWVDSEQRVKADSVGVAHIDGKVTNLAFGIAEKKWAQLVYLAGEELTLFREAAASPLKYKYCVYELINDVIGGGGSFDMIECAGNITEVDTTKDLVRANKWL